MKLAKAVIVLVDISGYTQFLHWNRNSLLHAEEIITELLEAVLDEAEYPLVLNKLEGDAALLYTLIEEEPQVVAKDVLKQVTRFIDAFRTRQQTLIRNLEGGCGCDACTNVHHLRLKAFLHTGEVVIKQVHQFTELAGNEVILLHRLLKNSLSFDEYILLTAPFFRLTGDILPFRSTAGTETFTDLGKINFQVYLPDPGPADLMRRPSRPMSKPRGILELLRFQWLIFWRRVTKQSLDNYNHLPGLEQR